MPENSVVTLLSDFGLQDVYVGVMKGAIARINPWLAIVDLTHQIPRQDIMAGRFNLMNAYAHFPVGTVHVGVVDPGVGSDRRAVAIAFQEGFLVGPDNGLFSGVLSLSPAIAAVELTNPEYWHTQQPSKTFHGRDIFAPVGAYLASGIPLEKLGNPIDPATLVQVPLLPAQTKADTILGYVQYIDSFGNLITNIPASILAGKQWSVSLKDLTIPNSHTYSDTESGGMIALVGSHGWLEMAVNGGSAESRLQMNVGSPVEVLINS